MNKIKVKLNCSGIVYVKFGLFLCQSEIRMSQKKDEIESDAHPDYVPAKAVPSTSTRGKRLLDRPQVQPKRSLNLVNNDTQAEAPSGTGKGRAMLRFGKYVNVSDRKVGALNEKGAVCIVDVGGVPCGKIIMQNGSSTTGLNQHLERWHPKESAAYKISQSTLQAERMSTKQTLVDHVEDLEGETIVILSSSNKIILWYQILATTINLPLKTMSLPSSIINLQ